MNRKSIFGRQVTYCNNCGAQLLISPYDMLGREFRVCSMNCVREINLKAARSLSGKDDTLEINHAADRAIGDTLVYVIASKPYVEKILGSERNLNASLFYEDEEDARIKAADLCKEYGENCWKVYKAFLCLGEEVTHILT